MLMLRLSWERHANYGFGIDVGFTSDIRISGSCNAAVYC